MPTPLRVTSSRERSKTIYNVHIVDVLVRQSVLPVKGITNAVLYDISRKHLLEAILIASAIDGMTQLKTWI